MHSRRRECGQASGQVRQAVGLGVRYRTLAAAVAGDRASPHHRGEGSWRSIAPTVALDSDEVAALQTTPCEPPDPAGHAMIRRLRSDPQVQYWPLNADRPIEPVPLDQHPTLDTFLHSGDLPSCLRQLETAIERADALEAVGTPY
jgi:hypothetical protein